MGDPSRRRIALLVLATALLAVAGCSSSSGGATHSSSPSSARSSTPPSTPTSTGAPTSDQLKAYLISPKQISGDTFHLTSTAPVAQDSAVGISGIFTNTHNNRVLDVILIRFPSPAYAQAGLSATQQLAAQQLTVTSLGSKSVPVGKYAQLYEGANTTGPLAILVYTEGRYVVSMQFVARAADDAVPDPDIVATGNAQDAKIKTAP